MSARLTIRTNHERPTAVARAVAPDNTDDMETDVQGGRVATTIERPDVASLRATADDYLKNVRVAARASAAAAAER